MAYAVGFTGTQRGMTPEQDETVRKAFRRMEDEGGSQWAAHGDCIGADAEFHDIAREFDMKVAIFPPENPSKRAWKEGDTCAEPKPYLDRNKDIVDEVDYMLATPGEFEEVLRSGTWSTIRYAIKQQVPVQIVFPDGTEEWR